MRRRTFVVGAALSAAALALPAAAEARRRSSIVGASSVAYRAFKPTSYWNTPLPVNAPIDAQSSAYIADAQKNSGSGMGLTLGTFAQPFYFAASTDPLQTVTASGKTVTLHVPANAVPMDSSDAELTIFDLSLNVCAGFHGARRDATGKLLADGLDKWHLDSNGLAGSLSESDDPYNAGHRGSPAPLRGIRLDEVQSGVIAHKVSAYWWATAPSCVFPMSGFESGKGGIVPEGMVARIKPSVDLTKYYAAGSANYVIAKCFQDYGVYVGDNSGSGSRVKLERINGTEWAELGVTATSLSLVPWANWQFIKRGYGA